MISVNSISRFLFIASCVILITPNSKALLLGSFIGCNSFGCRISALENDVAQLKQQMARLSPNGFGNTNTNGMMQPFGNQNGMNQMQGQQNQQGATNQGGQQQHTDPARVSFAMDYPQMNQQNTLRRNSNYPAITSQF